jgi:hypothetical protein
MLVNPMVAAKRKASAATSFAKNDVSFADSRKDNIS